MKIDKKSINMLLKLSDDHLWKALQYGFSKSGSDALKNVQKPSDMSKIRATLSALTDEDITRITEILNQSGGKK